MFGCFVLCLCCCCFCFLLFLSCCCFWRFPQKKPQTEMHCPQSQYEKERGLFIWTCQWRWPSKWAMSMFLSCETPLPTQHVPALSTFPEFPFKTSNKKYQQQTQAHPLPCLAALSIPFPPKLAPALAQGLQCQTRSWNGGLNVLVSICQGKPFWGYPIFDPHPNGYLCGV